VENRYLVVDLKLDALAEEGSYPLDPVLRLGLRYVLGQLSGSFLSGKLIDPAHHHHCLSIFREFHNTQQL
jgi:hypothetical protein